jgi:hypothetical protein
MGILNSCAQAAGGLLTVAPLINTCLLIAMLCFLPVYFRRHARLSTKIKEQQERLDTLEREKREQAGGTGGVERGAQPPLPPSVQETP